MKRVYFLVLIIVVVGLTAEASAFDVEEFAIWSAAGKHDRVVHGLSTHVWAQSSDPQLLILYCGARFATSSKDPTCGLNEKSAGEAKQFAGALWDTWLGKTRKARSAFEELVRHKDRAEWGKTGLLELAWNTENIQALGHMLDRFESDSATMRSKAFTEILRRYRLYHAEANSDWSKIHNIAGKHSFEQVTGNLALFSAYARALFIDGSEKELANLLNAAPAGLRETTDYLFRKAEYAVLNRGISESVAAIKEYSRRYPASDDFALQRAYIEALDSSPEVATAALATIYKVAKTSKRDVRLILGIATTLASYHKPDDAAAVFRLIDLGGVNFEDFAMFHTLQAWMAVYRGQLDDADASLNRALEMAPKQVAANHLKVLIAKERDKAEAGKKALKNLFESDPYNENYASLILYFRDRFRTPDLEGLFQEVLVRSDYYGQLMRHRIEDSERKTKRPFKR